MNEAAVIGIDVGGTKIAGGVIHFPSGKTGESRVIPTEARRGGRAVLDDVVRLALDLHDSPAALGLGICELVDRDGHLASAHSVDWQNLPVREELSAIAPVVIEADVRAAAMAEARFGAGRPFKTFLYVTVGTGISCCLIIDGEPYPGARGLTGTMASNALSIPCDKCKHPHARSLEEIASGPGLVLRYRGAGGKATTAEDMLRAAQAGDSVASGVIESASQALASVVATLVGTLDPEAVVVGGGLGLSKGAYWDQFVTFTRGGIWSGLQRDLPILQAETGVEAGWIGAGVCAARRFQLQQR